MDHVERLGRAIYESALVDPIASPDGGSIDIGMRIFGRHVFYEHRGALSEVTVARWNGADRIVLRRGLPAPRANFAGAVGVTSLFLRQDAWFMALPWPEQNDLVRQVAAWVVAPSSAVRARLERVGPNPMAIARAFCCTATCATMRISEVGGPASIVATPTAVYRRGDLLPWASDAIVRELAHKRSVRAVRRIPLLDEPERVALIAA